MRPFKLAAILATTLAISLPFITPQEVEARRGCCSHHGGVCGCKCCDGTSLSSKCAPYYPSCDAQPAAQAPAPKAAPAKPKPAVAATKPKGATFSAKVIGVSDGDTITVLEGSTQYKIRLSGIDAPESKQAFGQKAKQFTSALVFGKTVSVHVVDKDHYGRLVGDVTIDDKSLNQELVKAGLAWNYTQYSKSQILINLEKEARSAKRGLWSEASPVPPWEFRKAKRQK